MHNAKRMTMVALAVEIALASTYAQDDGALQERGEEASAIGQPLPCSALTLDTASLTNAWKDSSISVYKCTVLFQNFGKTVMEANGNAAAKRAQLDAATWKLLETGMGRAQIDGNLNLLLAYRAAFDSGLETLTGDNAEIVKIRTARAKRLAQIDADLMAAGVTAAHTLHANLECQKAELTKKGDIEAAVKVVGFQQKVAEWERKPQTQGQVAAIVSANAERPAAPRPQPRQSFHETKPVAPEAKIYTSDLKLENGTSIGNVDARVVARLADDMIAIPGKNYSIGKYEVTQALWEAVMGENPSDRKGAKLPVEQVSWDDCQIFLEKLNALPEVKNKGFSYRLPTTEEWEYACRAGAAGDYCKLADGTEISSDTLGMVAWYSRNSKETHPVGQKKPNAFGLYDMHGNVWEWTSMSNEGGRLLCGGGWRDGASFCGAGRRISYLPAYRDDGLGFRLAR